MRIGLIRHGRTAWNEAGRLQGRTDIPITDEERDRLSALRLPPAWTQADILASPLSRARETAEILAGTSVRTDDALMEMNLGAWEGKRGVDLLADPASGYTDVEEAGWDRRAPGGEDWRAVWARVQPVLDGLTRDTLIVSHMNVMRATLATAHDWDFASPMPFQIKRYRIYPLRLIEGVWRPDGTPERLAPR
jgi:probable phosphoglycerate mutase